MAQFKVKDVKGLVEGDVCKTRGNNITDESVITGIKIADAEDEGFIPGDLIIDAENIQTTKFTRKSGGEIWMYPLKSFKYRKPKHPETLSQDALKLIEDVKQLVESYPESVLQEFVAMRKIK